jgi:hypothetical protein
MEQPLELPYLEMKPSPWIQHVSMMVASVQRFQRQGLHMLLAQTQKDQTDSFTALLKSI